MLVDVHTNLQPRRAKHAHLRRWIVVQPHVLDGRDAELQLALREAAQVLDHRRLGDERAMPTPGAPSGVFVQPSR